MIVEINKNISGVQVELADNNFSSLIAALEKKDTQKANSWKSTNDAIMDIAIQKSQSINFSKAKEILDSLKNNPKDASFENRVIAKELMTMIANSFDAKGNTLEINEKHAPILSEQQIQYILKNVREIVKVRLITASNLENLEIKKICEGFNNLSPATKTQQAILDLIAPLN